MIRRPSVAYQFYPGDPGVLKNTIKDFVTEDREKEKAMGVISPHAGYVYSGIVAGRVYSHVTIPGDVILLGPNHTGLGEVVSISPSGTWEMPLGEVKVNEELARLIIENSPLFREDTLAHLREHSLEVQIPFLQYLNPSVEIVPITLMHLDFRRCFELGEALARSIKAYHREVLIVISSDMNHYESQETTIKKDTEAIEEILKLDLNRLWQVVKDRDISMCGIIPAIVGLKACVELGAKEAKLIEHMTSGDVSGDYGHVVGYAGILIK